MDLSAPTQPPKKRARTTGNGLGYKTIHRPDGKIALMVRSSTNKSMILDMSEPAPDEECSITLERISEYRLQFMPLGGCPVKDKPLLTKATLECGHGFNAMALLYHFAQNSMTCPCCRAGHEGVQMNEPSIPGHIRRQFLRQLDKVRAEDRREQIEADSAIAAQIIHHEVNQGVDGRGFELFLRVNRIVLILYAYETVDSLTPILIQELPLSSSRGLEDLMTFVSSGFCLRQLALNLRSLPMRAGAFEAVVATRNLFDGVMELHRSARFESGTADPVMVQRMEGAGMRVETLLGQGGQAQEISKFTWTVPRATFANMLVWNLTGFTARETMSVSDPPVLEL